MESSVSGVTDRSLESCGDESIHVMEVVEEQHLGGDDFDAQIEGLENVGYKRVADSNASDTVGPIKDTKNAAELPTSAILDKLDAQNGSIGETMVSSGEGVQMGTVPQLESLSLIHDYHSSRNRKRSQSLGYGFELGDMVWGKVKSHPWWPGHIFSEAFASLSVRRTKRDGQVLVAFFGDSSYGWFDPAELIPYEPHFAEKSQQTTSRNFVKAVEESVDESCRRSALGLTCFCRNPYNFRPTTVPGHAAADVFGYEAGGIYSHNQTRKARDNFQPERTLLFIKQLAVAPKEATMSLHFAKGRATALAYRRAVFQEFDETYAQAFGQKHVRPIAAPPPTVDQSVRAQLSGPLVIAESLSGHRSSTKALKSKEQTKRDRYLTKRRDESGDMGFSQIGQGYSSSSSSAACEVLSSQTAAGDYISQRRDEAVDQQEDGPPAKDEVASSSFSLSKAVAEAGNPMGQARPSIVQEKPDEMTVSKKAGVLKGVLKRSDTQKSDLGEKKKKKRRTDSPGSSDHLPKHIPAGHVGGASAKGESPGRPIQIDGPSQAVPAEESLGRPNQIVGPSRAVPAEGNVGELKRVLADLKVLALIPSHGRQGNRPAIARQIFLRFRSLVFQKSLALLPPSTSGDTEVSEIRSSKTPSSETTKIGPPSRLPKPSGRTNDPMKGGEKRDPSERQEDLAAKRAKKVSAVKSAAAAAAASASTVKTKAIPETQHTDGKTKGHGLAPRRIEAKVVPGVKIQPPKVRVEEPTFLVLKYSRGTSIPSSAELKARFARFGPMDTSQNRVFYATNTCRILFLYKEDAECAHRFALRNKSTFAQVMLKSNSVAPDSQAADKLGRDPGRAGEDVSVDHVQPTPPVMMPSPAVQLKSCLKKPAGDEGGSQSSSGARGARVRFNMGEPTGSDAGGGAQVKDPRTNDSSSSLQEPRPVSSLSSSLSVSKDSHNNKQKVFLTLPSQPPLVSTTLQYSLASRNNPAHVEPPSRSHSQNYNYASMLPPPPTPPPIQPPLPPPPPQVDISQQMLGLLTRCNDVVTNMKSILGYVPYHPL